MSKVNMWCVGGLLGLLVFAGCGTRGTSGGGGGGGGGGTPFGPLSFLNPADASIVTAPFEVSVSGPGIIRALFFLNSVVAADLFTPPFKVMVDPALLSKGSQGFRVVAIASTGAEQSTNFSVVVQRPRPPLADMLAAIAALPAGEWYEIPESNMRDVNLPSAQPRGDINAIYAGRAAAPSIRSGTTSSSGAAAAASTARISTPSIWTPSPGPVSRIRPPGRPAGTAMPSGS
ncbi:MAG: hypothetical protein HC813_02055 [Planctomycetes bacterium]|nr:hypothetical protein [Planctomycetota bacterium]